MNRIILLIALFGLCPAVGFTQRPATAQSEPTHRPTSNLPDDWYDMLREVVKEMAEDRSAVVRLHGENHSRVAAIDEAIEAFKEGLPRWLLFADDQARSKAWFGVLAELSAEGIGKLRADRDRLIAKNHTDNVEDIADLDIAIAWATVQNRHEERNRESLANAEEERHPISVPPDELKREISERRSSYQTAEAKSRKLAESLRQSTPGVTKTDLRIAVDNAFNLRQNLLRAELAEMQERLQKARRSLESRDEVSHEIVDRRVADLMNPQLDWEASPDLVEAAAAEVKSTRRPQAVTLNDLQGIWDLEFEDAGFTVSDTEAASQFVVEFQENLMTVTRMLGNTRHVESVMEVRLGEDGSPQPVDFIEHLDGGLSHEVHGIIEHGYGQVRLCFSENGGRPKKFIAEDESVSVWRLKRSLSRRRQSLSVTLDADGVSPKDLPQQCRGGLRLNRIYADGPADTAGLKNGDILIGLGEWQINGMDDLKKILSMGLLGDVECYIVRNGEVFKGPIRLDQSPRTGLHVGLQKCPPVALNNVFPPVTLDGLQGRWEMVRPGRLSPMLVTIRGNTILADDPRAFSAEFELKEGSPQPIDLINVISKEGMGKLNNILNSKVLGLIQNNLGLVRIVFEPSESATRPTSVSAPHMYQTVWELRRVSQPINAVPKSPMFSKLQGVWAFDELTVDDPVMHQLDGKPAGLYEIRGNVMSSVPNEPSVPTWYLRPVSGAPQAIDVCHDQAGENFMPGIIEIQENMVRICVTNSFDRDAKRPKEMAVGPTTDIMVLRRPTPALTSLEGDWHLVECFRSEPLGEPTAPIQVDSKNEIRSASPPIENLTIRGQMYTVTSPTATHVSWMQAFANLDVDSSTENGSINLMSKPFTSEDAAPTCSAVYFLEDDVLTIQTFLSESPEGSSIKQWRRGHRAFPKSLAPASDQQQARWRSAIVDLYAESDKATPAVAPVTDVLVGRGVVVSATGLILTNVSNDLESQKLSVVFDNGARVPVSIVDDVGEGYYSLQIADGTSVSHYFECSSEPYSVGDEVYDCGYHSDESRIFTVPAAKLVLVDRKAPGLGINQWQLQHTSELSGHRCCPLLSADGHLVGMTKARLGTPNEVLLACPASEFQHLFAMAKLNIVGTPPQATATSSVADDHAESDATEIEGDWHWYQLLNDAMSEDVPPSNVTIRGSTWSTAGEGQPGLAFELNAESKTIRFKGGNATSYSYELQGDSLHLHDQDHGAILKRGHAATASLASRLIQGEWRQDGWVDESGEGLQGRPSNVTIDGTSWTTFASGKTEVTEFNLDPSSYTITFNNNPSVSFKYQVTGDAIILSNGEELMPLTRGHRPGPNEATELEGHWHLVSRTDEDGKTTAASPANLTLRGDQYWWDRSSGRGTVYRAEVHSTLRQLRIYDRGDYSSFFLDEYSLEGNQLTLRDDDSVMILQRGHVRIPLELPAATEQQLSLWQSAMVEISYSSADGKDGSREVFGRGVVVSKDGMILTHANPTQILTEDEKLQLKAEFDDGSQVAIEIIEEHDFGLLILQPRGSTVEVNHFFGLSKSGCEIGDQVYAAGDHNRQGHRIVEPCDILQKDRRIASAAFPAWQLKPSSHLITAGCEPILNANGELVAFTLNGTGSLLLALPVEQFPTLFPNTFAN